MEKTKKSQFVLIVALVMAVIGLTLGFAAFSKMLNINSTAYVSPNSDDFKVTLSISDKPTDTKGEVSGTTTGNATAELAELNKTTIKNIRANLTSPGETVTYTFYAHNTGEYHAFLNSIIYENVEGNTSPKVCTAISPETTSAALVSAACEDISLTIQVGEEMPTAGSKATITGHGLLKKAQEIITVTIAYDANGERADGNFNVEFGNIQLIYGTID